MLIKLADSIKEPLCILFNRSLDTGVVPDDWKKANVTPIFKSGQRENTCNYRPVSLTSHISKVMESILKDSIARYLNEKNLLNSSQHGFTNGRSCLTNLLCFLSQWLTT